jgi:ribosome biogenesis GTPase
MSSSEGTIITRFGAEMIVRDDDGNTHRGTGRKKVSEAVCGDRVLWKEQDQGNASVQKILPRRNLLERPVSYGRVKKIAANIDQMLITIAHGMKPNWEMLDHYLVATHALNATAVIVCNKSDLANTDKDFDQHMDEYKSLGYRIIHCSVQDESGVEELVSVTPGHTSIFVGQSGVGKSSLIQKILPDMDIRIGEVSEKSGEGQHTTSVATLYQLPDGGDLIDSPGVRDFRPGAMNQSEIEHGFPEFDELIGQCRFHNCTHTHEPGCAIRHALDEGDILQRRYESYLRLLEEGTGT